MNFGMDRNQIWNTLECSGAKIYAQVPKERFTKWDALIVEGVLVGYSGLQNSTHIGYRILYTSSNKVMMSRTVTFDEGNVILQKFIDVTDTHQPSNADAGCKVQPSHPNLEC